MGRARWAPVVLVVALVSGCGLLDQPGPVVDLPPGPTATIHDTWPGCQALKAFAAYGESPPDLGAGRVPTEFTTQAVVLCTVRDDPPATPVDDQRSPALGVERRGVDPADVHAVLDYLALPSQSTTHPDNMACPAMAQIMPWWFLLDADLRWIQPALPLDPCGFTRGTFDGTPAPYTSVAFTDTAVCRVPVDGEWRCVPL